tara:strand:+ start:381 stop:644 length:264 start_codon:yes stop_codon:yes gene_type:complete
MEIKGFLFFLGTLLRWPALNPKQFFTLHLYILSLYAVTYLVKILSLNLSYFVFTVGSVAPLMLAISRGLPLDCLNYRASIDREVSSV